MLSRLFGQKKQASLSSAEIQYLRNLKTVLVLVIDYKSFGGILFARGFRPGDKTTRHDFFDGMSEMGKQEDALEDAYAKIRDKRHTNEAIREIHERAKNFVELMALMREHNGYGMVAEIQENQVEYRYRMMQLHTLEPSLQLFGTFLSDYIVSIRASHPEIYEALGLSELELLKIKAMEFPK